MKRKLAMFALLTAATLCAQSGNDLFQQALLKERSQGDLAGAIQIYERILKQHGSDRKLASQALLQIAHCQERQGSENARRTYERLIKEYADQPQTAAEARARISALSAAAVPNGPRIRQLWAGPDVDNEGGVSPDGRSLTYAHWETGDLGVRDLQNNTFKLLTNTGGWEKSGGQFAEDSLYSPDGKLIAYNWFIQEKDHEIRLMNADGSGARTLFAGPGWVVPQAWSSDGKSLAVLQYDGEGMNSIHLVQVASGEARTLLPRTADRPWDMTFSPDGRWLVFDMRRVGSSDSDIYILPVAGGPARLLLENPAQDMAPVWSADGKSLRFLSNRSGAYGLWEVAVSQGSVVGPARLLKGELGSSVWPVGFTKSGSYVYSLQTGGTDVYEVDYDAVSGKATSKPRLISDRVPGGNRFPAYSPDGASLAWVRNEMSDRTSSLVIRDLSTGEERVFEINRGNRAVTWSPDSRRILLQSRSDEPNTHLIIEFDRATSAFSELLKVQPSRNPLRPCFSADGKTLYYVFREWPSPVFQVMAYDFETRQRRSLYTSPGRVFALNLAPDKRNLVLLLSDRNPHRSLLLLPLDGGEPRELAAYQSFGGDFAASVALTADGKSAVVRANVAEGAAQPSDLLRIDLASGAVTPLGVSMRSIQSPGIHPSGRKLVFAAGQPESEIWIAENILPPSN